MQQNALRTKVQLLARQLKAEKDLSKALARACAELAAEKAMLLAELEDERLRFTLRLEGQSRYPKSKLRLLPAISRVHNGAFALGKDSLPAHFIRAGRLALR